MNLKNETTEAVASSGHTPDQIIFIGSEKTGHRCTWEEFCKLADREYSSGYGASEVAKDLVVVFEDSQKLWRGEYDGSEWWEFSKPFEMPAESHPIETLFAADKECVGWCDLSELNAIALAPGSAVPDLESKTKLDR